MARNVMRPSCLSWSRHAMVLLLVLSSCAGPRQGEVARDQEGRRLDKGEDSPQASIEMLVPRGEYGLPVAAIWNESNDLDSPSTDSLVMAVWGSGRVVWSADALRGGPPYYSGHAPCQAVEHLLAEVRSLGWFHDQDLCRYDVGPEADCTTISITDGRGRLQMTSWHELYETNPNLVGTAHGLNVLEGRQRSEVLADQPANYLRFRQVWADIRVRLRALVPKDGFKIGDLQFTKMRFPREQAARGSAPLRTNLDRQYQVPVRDRVYPRFPHPRDV